ncbi:MAG: RagB/SusD family nutrient uptake outer membrane protein [Flaviaesturariibacter sp.]|nr:RagB/SusD family nutrient uptake outer membrane protein [Flaviaesturariibacter sp.]
MKRFHIILPLLSLLAFSCRKNIDQAPQSNLSTATFYSNLAEMKAALAGCYNGLQAPLINEWRLTELRSDNTKQGVTGSTSIDNQDMNELDMFAISSTHPNVLSYWLSTYANVRNANVLLQKLGVVYDAAAGTTAFRDMTLPVSAADRKQVAGEALFIRAYHYFNLVRLYGGVFIVHEPVSPNQALVMTRASVAETYKFIEADLRAAIASMNGLTYTQQTATDLLKADVGRATTWAAKGLLAKVYLTQGKKAEAIALLLDVKNNSGYSLQSSYANVFSTVTEVNSEILFTIRYKAGGLGLGAPFANYFAPLNSGSNVVLGDGKGWNYPTADIDTTTNGDPRKPVLMGFYAAGNRLYVKKYLSTVAIVNDAENDWPVLRYADILLMLAEAQGYSPESIQLINQVRQRAGAPLLDPTVINTVALFEKALSNERRIEFAFENQRWFDLVRFNTTLTTITAEQTMKDHFAREYFAHYRLFPAPTPTLTQLQDNVTHDHLLLPIPQREIDTNTGLAITQNPGY